MNLNLFKKIVSINSIYPNEEHLSLYLISYLKELGFTVKKQYLDSDICENEKDTTRFNILAEKGEGDGSLLFYSHVDTVPVHDKELWKTDPFTLTQSTEESHVYYGLGSVDMKGWLFSILEAVKDMEITGYKLKIALGVDEEYWSKWGTTLARSSFLDDVKLVIVPELWDAENVKYGRKNLILGRRGRCLIQVNVPWKSCHGANAPAFGINAITQASIIAKEIDENHQITKTHDKLPDGNQFIKYFHSSVSSLSVPDSAVMYIDRHTVPGETEESVISEIEEIINNLYTEGKLTKIENQKVSIHPYKRPTPSPLAYVVEESHTYVDLVKNAITSNDLELRIAYGYSVADENIIAKHIDAPVLTLGADGGNEHAANEWVDMRSIEDLIRIYKSVIEKFQAE